MEKHPLLSICIPTYNREKYLRECLDNIINQQGFNTEEVEVIVSDNASPDNTTSLVENYQKEHKNIRYFKNKENLGPQINMKNLIFYAQGTYILFLSDDDKINDGKLSVMLEYIKNNQDVGFFLTGYIVFDDMNDFIAKGKQYSNKDRIFADTIVAVKELFFVSHDFSGIILKRSLIQKDIVDKYYTPLYYYPQIGLSASVIKLTKSMYIAHPLMKLRINTTNYWSYNSDYFLKEKLSLIEDVGIHGISTFLTNRAVRDMAYPLFLELDKSIKSWLVLLKEIRKISNYSFLNIHFLYAIIKSLLIFVHLRFINRSIHVSKK